MQIKVIILTTFLLSLFFFPSLSFAQDSLLQPVKEEKLEGVVTKIIEEKEREFEGIQNKKQLYQKLEIQITKGSKKDTVLTIENGSVPAVTTNKYQAGDELIITATKDFQGKNVYFITDYVRRTPLYWLFFIFVGLTVLIGRKRGLAALIGMAISFLIIFSFILPLIAKGNDPILIAITASLGIIPVTFYLSHGVNKKTTMAVIGTIIALVLTGILATIFVEAAKLTGFASEEAGFLEAAHQGVINMKGLLLAGIIIGVLGILDDITISQAAIVQQLKETAPNISFTKLYSRAMDIGQDHIASVVNTLILVYTGAALPLLLLFTNNPLPFSEVINYEIIAEEIIRTLVASIGLILAVPITTFLAAYFLSASRKEKST